MVKGKELKKILIIGSGPIIIGQACNVSKEQNKEKLKVHLIKI